MKQIRLRGKHSDKFALVDDDDYEVIAQHKWYYNRGYVCRRTATETIYMHRLIAGTSPGRDTDHVNGDRLDNRRANLRECSRRKNNTNRTSDHNPLGRNVWDNKTKNYPYSVSCSVRNRHIYGGRYKTVREANVAAVALRRKLGYLEPEQGALL